MPVFLTHPIMKSNFLLLTALAALPCTVTAAPIAVTGTITHTENFDSLGIFSPAWADDSTLPGWYVQINNGATVPATAQATDGNDATPFNGLLNCGTLDATDRALGSKATGTGNFANIAYAVSFHNTTANPIQFTGLTYTGECWRTNSTAAGLAETYTVFYQISAAPVTDILSGGNAAAAAAGAGFTALGATANWASPVLTPVASAVDGNDAANRTTVTYTAPAAPPAALILQPGQYLMLKWTDTNLGSTDGYQAIDDVSVSFTQLEASVSSEYSQRTRDLNNTPSDSADDTFGFTALISGTGAVSTWTTASVQPPLSNVNSGPYGTPVAWTGFPIAAKTVTISDVNNPAFTTTLTVQPPLMIGTNELAGPGMPIYNIDAPVTGWTINDGQRTLTQNNPGAQTDFVILSEIMDLSAIGFAQFRADLDAITGGSSGFEAADRFAMQLIIDGGAPVNILGAADTNGDGWLTGAATNGNPDTWVELPDVGDINRSQTFTFTRLIPETANTLQVRISGSSNSGAETYLVRNLRLTNPPASILASLAGASVLDNRGTVDALDDTFSAPVNVLPVNIPGATGWNSNATPASGPYSPPAISFGPFPRSEAPKTVQILDQATPFISASIIIPGPPVTLMDPLTVTGITRVDNGPGPADDSITFQLTITGTSTGPLWGATGATPLSGLYSALPATFTIPAPLPASPHNVTITDASYPAATRTVSVAFPAIYTIGQKNFGGPADIYSADVTPPDTSWVNDATARTLTMTDGDLQAAGVKTVTSEPVDLSAVSGAVLFSATLETRDTSSGFEAGDTFVAELLLSDGFSPAQTVNLIVPHDTNASGLLEDDELALGGGTVAAPTITTFPLNALIPDGIVSATLVIRGINDSANETMIVRDVLFAPAPPTTDNDGDGVSNTDETVMGTDPDNPLDVLRLTQNAANPTQIDFPTVALRYYRVYQSDDTDGAEGTHLQVWRDAGLPTIQGDGSPNSFDITISPGEPRRFYRLHVMTQDGPWP
jgi:hypothetical protein